MKSLLHPLRKAIDFKVWSTAAVHDAILVELTPPSETVAGNAKARHQICLALRAATGFVFTDLKLDVVGALTPSFVLAPIFVQLIGLIVAAPEFDEAFEAHLVGGGTFYLSVRLRQTIRL